MKNIVYVFTSCKKCGPIQVMYNLIKNLDKKMFKVYLITIYDEVEGESRLPDFLALGVQHFKVRLNKIQILLGKTKELKRKLLCLKPDVVHSLGVFPDYCVSKYKLGCHFITLHNYLFEDFVMKFGKIKGFLLEKIHLKAIKKANKIVTCSKSLSILYKKKGMFFDYIQNGIDTNLYNCVANIEKKKELRISLNIPDKTVFLYSGQFINRKNQLFLLETFTKHFQNSNVLLILLGDGVNYNSLKEKYNNVDFIKFKGNVNNVDEYLKASDYYISSSLSEGMPMGVLEAMASGLPVILSNIPQHIELYDESKDIGAVFDLKSTADCYEAINSLIAKDYATMSNASLNVVRDIFSAEKMAKRYQEEYIKLIDKGDIANETL